MSDIALNPNHLLGIIARCAMQIAQHANFHVHEVDAQGLIAQSKELRDFINEYAQCMSQYAASNGNDRSQPAAN